MKQAQTRSVGSRSLVLVGLMGAGKSTVGRRLAAALGRTFKDADAEIEAAAGRTVAEFFDAYGEAAFRDGERRVIARLLNAERPIVLATGGGAFMDAETRALVKERGVSLWLHADIEVILKRVARRNTRPLLRVEDPRAVLERLIEERYPVYAEADIKVESADGPHERTVRRALEALQAYERGEHAEP